MVREIDMALKYFRSVVASVVAEWLGRRTLNQKVVGSNPGEGMAWYLCAGYLKIHSSGVAIISRIACGTPITSVKKTKNFKTSILKLRQMPSLTL
jgi:hypothetical protein